MSKTTASTPATIIVSASVDTARLKGIMRSQKAQAVAKSYAARFRKTCKQVVDRGGAGADT